MSASRDEVTLRLVFDLDYNPVATSKLHFALTWQVCRVGFGYHELQGEVDKWLAFGSRIYFVRRLG